MLPSIKTNVQKKKKKTHLHHVQLLITHLDLDTNKYDKNCFIKKLDSSD